MSDARRGTAQVHIRPAGRQGVSGVTATVFGCTGFLGRYVVQRLGRMGCQVIVPFRGDGMNARHLKLMGDLGQIVHVPINVRDPETIVRALSHSQVVVNLIGLDQETRNFSFHDTHVKIPYLIAHAAQKAGVQRLIHVSALGADPASKSQWIASKGQGEQAVFERFPSATVVRPAVMFGAEDRFLNRIASLINSLHVLPLVNDGVQLLQPVYVDDVAAGIVGAIDRPSSAGQLYELGGPERMSFSQVCKLVHESIGKRELTVALDSSWARNYAKLIEYLPPKFRFVTADQVTQMEYHFVVEEREGVKTFKDLGLESSPIRKHALSVLIRHRKERGIVG